MQLSPLQLEEYLLKELRYGLVSPLSESPKPGISYDPLDIEVNAETGRKSDDPLAWRCQVTVRSKDENEGIHPYTFQLTYVGFFRVVKEFPPDRVEQMVKANAPALLYSAAREALVSLTGRGRLPAIILPSVTFIEPPTKVAPATPKATKKAAKTSRKE
jgi:preprotein translocase subunit SecB